MQTLHMCSLILYFQLFQFNGEIKLNKEPFQIRFSLKIQFYKIIKAALIRKMFIPLFISESVKALFLSDAFPSEFPLF